MLETTSPFYRTLHLGNFLGAFVDEQYHHVDLRMVVLYGMRDAPATSSSCPALGGENDQSALPFFRSALPNR